VPTPPFVVGLPSRGATHEGKTLGYIFLEKKSTETRPPYYRALYTAEKIATQDSNDDLGVFAGFLIRNRTLVKDAANGHCWPK